MSFLEEEDSQSETSTYSYIRLHLTLLQTTSQLPTPWNQSEYNLLQLAYTTKFVILSDIPHAYK